MEQHDVIESNTHAAPCQGVAHVDSITKTHDSRLDDGDGRQPAVWHAANTVDLQGPQEWPLDVIWMDQVTRFIYLLFYLLIILIALQLLSLKLLSLQLLSLKLLSLQLLTLQLLTLKLLSLQLLSLKLLSLQLLSLKLLTLQLLSLKLLTLQLLITEVEMPVGLKWIQ